jgi:hypothetical protein
MTKEKLMNHLAELQKKHKKLDEELLEEYRHYGRDDVIKKYKYDKLMLKTEIDKIEKQLKAG